MVKSKDNTHQELDELRKELDELKLHHAECHAPESAESFKIKTEVKTSSIIKIILVTSVAISLVSMASIVAYIGISQGSLANAGFVKDFIILAGETAKIVFSSK